jgi:hypothetical protein
MGSKQPKQAAHSIICCRHSRNVVHYLKPTEVQPMIGQKRCQEMILVMMERQSSRGRYRSNTCYTKNIVFVFLCCLHLSVGSKKEKE